MHPESRHIDYQTSDKGPKGIYGSHEWTKQSVRLKLLLGEFKFGDIVLPGFVLRTHFADMLECEVPAPPTCGLPEGVDVIKYPSFPTDHIFPRLTTFPKAIRYVPARYRRHYIIVEGSFSDYLKKFTGKSRANRRREVRRFEEFSGGMISWREFSAPAEMAVFHQIARRVSRLTYQDRLLKAGLPDNQDFIDGITRLAAKNEARGFVLFHDAHPVAFVFCSVTGGNIIYRYIGYDQEYKTWSPGTVLLYLILERVFQEGRAKIFDFTEGEGSQKEIFANRSTWCADLLYCRRTPRIRALLSAHATLNTCSEWGARSLRKLGLIARLRRVLRDRTRAPTDDCADAA